MRDGHRPHFVYRRVVMIDIAYIQKILFDDEDSRKIDKNDYITFDIIELLSKGTISKVQNCFKKVDDIGDKYKVQLKCADCGILYNDRLNKTSLLKIISNINKCKCENCTKIHNEELFEKEQRLKQDSELIKQQNTDSYIRLYLTPGNSFKKETPIKERIDCIMNCYIDDDKIADYVKSLSYDDFLNTPYWNGISFYMKKCSNFKCSLCGSNKNLNTHHKYYSQHGYEHKKNIAKDMLCVLCEQCHSKFHNIV